MKLFAFDGPVSGFLEKIFDLVALHILWLLFCLPLFTIGASTTALCRVSMKMAANENGYICRGFLKAFRENFKKSTIIWLSFVTALLWCVAMILFCQNSGNQFLKVLAIPEAAVIVLLLSALTYVFFIQANYENTVIKTIKNAFILSLRFLPYTAALMAIFCVPVLITAYVEEIYAFMLFIWIFAGSSVIVYAQSHLMKIIFKKVSV